MIEYNILASGSRGNCVIINDVMIDCGLSFYKMKDHLYDVKYLLLTHIHSDHIRPKTLEKIEKLFPKIEIIGNYQVAQFYPVDHIANPTFSVKTKDYIFLPFELTHDVMTTGYVFEMNNQRMIYATDTNSLERAPDPPFDYFFIESNYDEKKLHQMAKQFTTRGYNPVKAAQRHLSTQTCKTFYYLNRRSKDSQLIELHKSERFY